MKDFEKEAWIPLLVPDMPSPEELLPWLERIHAVKKYSNFGPLVLELESNFARRFGIDRTQLATVSSATQGLELVLQALELPAESRVLVPALTFVATATAVIRAGHKPVLADVDAQNWMLTPDIARTICERMQIDAVLPVATFGMPHDMQAWQQFEQDTKLPVIIDAAAAYGSQWLQGFQGTLVFSLHTTKSLPAGEGGLVVSTRPGLCSKIRQLSNFGINLDPSSVSMPVGALASLGTNAKMSEYHAAVGLISLQKWEKNADARRLLNAELMAELNKASGQRLVWQAEGLGGQVMAPTLLCAQLPDSNTREVLENACKNAYVMTRRWYQPVLNRINVINARSITLEAPNAEALGLTLLGLPFFLGMTSEQKSRLAEVLKQTFN